MGKRAWSVRREALLVGGRGLEMEAVVVVAAFGFEGGVGRLLRRDERKALGVGRGRGCGGCGGGGGGIGWGREAARRRRRFWLLRGPQYLHMTLSCVLFSSLGKLVVSGISLAVHLGFLQLHYISMVVGQRF